MRAITKRIGKYEILGELRREPMGVVYRGREPISGRPVEINTIARKFARTPGLVESFYRGGRAAAALKHPNIIAVYETGKHWWTPYIVYELLEGDDLAHIVAKEEGGKYPLPASIKLNYIMQVCRALEYAHKREIVHRDIKPGNIFVTTEGTVKLVNFGLARLSDNSSPSSGVVIGTIEYMSPEQIRGENMDGRSDIWSVGATLFEILTYTKPFRGDNIMAWMSAIVSQEPRELRELRPDLPLELDDVIRRTFKKDPAERYQSMAELLIDLEAVHRKMTDEPAAPS